MRLSYYYIHNVHILLIWHYCCKCVVVVKLFLLWDGEIEINL